MEFKAFTKIERLNKAQMNVTQKIHGTNAQVAILPADEVKQGHSRSPSDFQVDGQWYQLLVGSRTRWIYPGDDNYGFAAFVHANKDEFVRKLGVGVHFGEWVGSGINSGEGLSEKTFVLFDFWKYPPERPLPYRCAVVPVLYSGPMDLSKIEEIMNDLKTNGSKLAPGFMRPEGVVIQVLGTRYKKVFEEEETQWTQGSGQKVPKDLTSGIDYSHLMQPIRLEKLLSRDERFTRDFPKSLPEIVKAYYDDLVAEEQIKGTEGEVKAVKKGSSSQIFNFVRTQIEAL